MTDVVLTSLLTALSDPQRDERMSSDPKVLQTLSDSVQSLSAARLVILSTNPQVSDLLGSSEMLLAEQTISPYIQRWLEQYRYLRDHPEIDRVWCVDGTDVEMMKNPFVEMESGLVYVGSEPARSDIPWMKKNFKGRIMDRFFVKHGSKPLLNAGLLGGSRFDVMNFCHRMIAMWENSEIDAIAKTASAGFVRRQVVRDRDLKNPVLDMGLFNVVARNGFKDRLSYGDHVNTRFKAFDYDNGTDSWWRHK